MLLLLFLQKVKVKLAVVFPQLRSPMQIMMGVAAEQQAEMETMIRDLEAENRFYIPSLD